MPTIGLALLFDLDPQYTPDSQGSWYLDYFGRLAFVCARVCGCVGNVWRVVAAFLLFCVFVQSTSE